MQEVRDVICPPTYSGEDAYDALAGFGVGRYNLSVSVESIRQLCVIYIDPPFVLTTLC